MNTWSLEFYARQRREEVDRMETSERLFCEHALVAKVNSRLQSSNVRLDPGEGIVVLDLSSAVHHLVDFPGIETLLKPAPLPGSRQHPKSFFSAQTHYLGGCV